MAPKLTHPIRALPGKRRRDPNDVFTIGSERILDDAELAPQGELGSSSSADWLDDTSVEPQRPSVATTEDGAIEDRAASDTTRPRRPRGPVNPHRVALAAAALGIGLLVLSRFLPGSHPTPPAPHPEPAELARTTAPSAPPRASTPSHTPAGGPEADRGRRTRIDSPTGAHLSAATGLDISGRRLPSQPQADPLQPVLTGPVASPSATPPTPTASEPATGEVEPASAAQVREEFGP